VLNVNFYSSLNHYFYDTLFHAPIISCLSVCLSVLSTHPLLLFLGVISADISVLNAVHVMSKVKGSWSVVGSISIKP